MKKALLVLLVLATAFAGWAAPYKLTLLGLANTPLDAYVKMGWVKPVDAVGSGITDYLISLFQKENPGVAVEQVLTDITTGSTISMDALIASGNAPDVYFDAPMRMSKYMVPEFALDLTPYITDWDDINPVILAQYKRDGKILGLPAGGWATAFALNMDLVNGSGYKGPIDNWTIADFLTLAKMVKAKYPDCYATYLFAANQSGDQWWFNWFYSFGAQMYNPGDYSKTTLNSPQGVAALKFLKSLIDNGYAPKDASTQDDDTSLALFAAGKVAGGAMQPAHTVAVIDAAKQGVIPWVFPIRFTTFPRAPGVTKVPVAAGVTSAVVHKTNDPERNRLATRLAYWLCGKEYQEMSVYGGALLPVRKSVPWRSIGFAAGFSDQVKKILDANGSMDLGILTPKFSQIRAVMFPLLQQYYNSSSESMPSFWDKMKAFFTGKPTEAGSEMTAEGVLKEYETQVNAILAGK